MDLNEKIKLILEQKNISPSIFADEIGVQRSSISHILAGRNKPSLDIVQKVVKRFPELGVNWIWDDETLPAMSDDSRVYSSKTIGPSISKSDNNTASELSGRNENTASPVVHKNTERQTEPQKKDKVIKKVMILYSDGTFEEFKSA